MTEDFVRKKSESYDSGHDWWHIERVRHIAAYINDREKMADPFILEIVALLHDSADSKFSGTDYEQGFTEISKFMDNAGLSEIRELVAGIVKNVSFSNKSPAGNIKDPVLLVVQDADRLDAIGAIGIARAFNYGGFRNRAIYFPVTEMLAVITPP